MLVLAAVLAISFGHSDSLNAQAVGEEILGAARYRAIGPTVMSGRFVDVAVYENDPAIFYAATATGGLWKTVNNGVTYQQVFENQSVMSGIGAVAVAQTDPDIVWVGSGESNMSRTAYYGDGVYKSVDGGETWTNMGLRESRAIGRIMIHPTNPDIVWVASPGPLYSDNDVRGVYKTTDGGETWRKTLSVISYDKHIGAIDIAVEHGNPDIMYAATYDKIRTPWTFNHGGPGSGVYKSEDGGETWRQLTNGLPDGHLGRISIDISRSHPNIVYASIENANVDGVSYEERRQQLLVGNIRDQFGLGEEIYRSDDRGETWERRDPNRTMRGSRIGYYLIDIRVNPQDPDHIYKMSVSMHQSFDGGMTWSPAPRRGADHHAMWINPENPDHYILGWDQGIGVTFDNGRNFLEADDLNVVQFVSIGYDFNYPYNVYGGTQDNGSIMGPSTKRDGRPIWLEHWRRTGGGDGMYNVVDINNRYLYNGSQFGPFTRRDLRTWEAISVRIPEMDRWSWNHPIVASAHNADVVYRAGNRVVRSRNSASTWEFISDDLTTQDQAKIEGIGNIQYCAIVTLEESTVRAGILWAGTDDGKVWVTPDDGGTWNDVTDNIPDHPGYWVSRVQPSHADEGTAYVTITGHRNDDDRPFVYKTTDWGATFTSINGNLPNDESVYVIREHPNNPDLLFVGTTRRVHVSFNGGQTWNSLQNNMPLSPVEDLKIHPRENDLMVATHGRSLFIADIAYMEEISDETLAKDFHLFTPQTRVKWRDTGRNYTSTGNYNGPSEPVAAHIYYYLKDEPAEARIEVLDGARVIFANDLPTDSGVNRFLWNYTARPPQAQTAAARRGVGAVSVRPGEYTIRLTVDGESQESRFVLLEDVWY